METYRFVGVEHTAEGEPLYQVELCLPQSEIAQLLSEKAARDVAPDPVVNAGTINFADAILDLVEPHLE